MNGAGAVRYDVSLFTDHDIYLFREGSHYRLYDKMGSHFLERDGGVEPEIGRAHV